MHWHMQALADLLVIFFIFSMLALYSSCWSLYNNWKQYIVKTFCIVLNAKSIDKLLAGWGIIWIRYWQFINNETVSSMSLCGLNIFSSGTMIIQLFIQLLNFFTQILCNWFKLQSEVTLVRSIWVASVLQCKVCCKIGSIGRGRCHD